MFKWIWYAKSWDLIGNTEKMLLYAIPRLDIFNTKDGLMFLGILFS